MATNIQGEFIAKIISTLQKNGFPEKKVALPIEKMYESAHTKGINFNRILEFLEQHENILHEKQGDRIIFFHKEKMEPESAATNSFMPNFDALKNMNLGAMMGQMQEMMKNISPQQMADIQNMVKNMSPDQISQIQDMMKNLSPDQLCDLKEKADKFVKKD